MNTPINYITQLSERSEVGKKPTRFTAHGDGDRPVLLDDGRFSFLFVLQGELVCGFSGFHSAVALTASQMMAVDKHQLRELRCVGDTVILEYMISDAMATLMQSTSKAFKTPCSEGITLNSSLHTWCNTLFADLSKQPARDNRYHRCQCSELTAMLLKYPHNVLGTLYIPLYVCSKHCHLCKAMELYSNLLLDNNNTF